MRALIAFISPGRPTRFASWVHFNAISFPCHRMRVSGVTIVATGAGNELGAASVRAEAAELRQ
jgi:hypothetical protein